MLIRSYDVRSKSVCDVTSLDGWVVDAGSRVVSEWQGRGTRAAVRIDLGAVTEASDRRCSRPSKYARKSPIGKSHDID